jgi:uncharacterized protein YndB with AHSA1/START domain
MSESRRAATRRTIEMERTYTADVQDVWDLWTTKDGIESWWGPGGFAVTVHAIDLRPGGELRYAMTAIDPPQVAFMQQHGMQLTTEARLTYTEVAPLERLSWIHVADFVPGVDPYGVLHVLELFVDGTTVRMVLTVETMHDDEWTQRAVMGWESELGKLAAVVERSRA